jgi:hypothetical protein
MIDHNQILILIDSFAVFFQGFSFRRKHVPIMLISSLIMLFILGLSVILNGTGVYTNALSNIGIYDVIAIAYVLFWWISGYIIGGFRRRKDKENIGNKCKIGEDECGNS